MTLSLSVSCTHPKMLRWLFSLSLSLDKISFVCGQFGPHRESSIVMLDNAPLRFRPFSYFSQVHAGYTSAVATQERMYIHTMFD